MAQGKDERGFSRAPVEVKAVLVAPGLNTTGLVTDLSLSGAFVKTGEAPAEGERVGLNLLLTMGDEPLVIETTGRVAWRSDDGAAVSFLSVASEGFAHLQRLVLYNAPDPGCVEEEQRHSLGIRRRDGAADF